jgi:hypothetical protein
MSERKGPLSTARLNMMLQSVSECVARVAILVAQSQERIARGQTDALSFSRETRANDGSMTLANRNDTSGRAGGAS